jgi:cAMP-dependent protein kinase regulator
MKSIDIDSDSDNDNEDNDEKDDHFGDETDTPKQQQSLHPPVVAAARKPGNRRFSVSSESLDPSKLKEEISKITIVPKDPQVMQTLYQVVSKSTMLKRMLEPEERTLIVKAFAGPVFKKPGEDIIRQGEIGDVFYLLEHGVVDVFVNKPGQPQQSEAVHTYHDGDAFGQLALMYNAPRAATCRAASDCKLWTLDRTSFKVIIAGAALRKREMYLAFLAQVPILQSLNENEKLLLTDSLTEEKFPDQAIICQEGQYGNDFYIILEGRVNCFQKVTNSSSSSTSSKESTTEKLVLSLSAGQYFGEIALLTSKPRQATVRAEGEVKVLIIDRATFTRVFGPLEHMLKRNMDLYSKYSQQALP